MTNALEVLKQKIVIKQNQQLSDLDREKIEIINYFINNPESFFDLNNETIMGIFEFLDISLDQREQLFNDLVSPEAFLKIPKVREVITNIHSK